MAQMMELVGDSRARLISVTPEQGLLEELFLKEVRKPIEPEVVP